MAQPKFGLEVDLLSGVNGNIFVLMGTVTKAMRREMQANPDSGITQESITDFINEIMECDSYNSALVVIMSTVYIN
jgi:hypothetical protein